MKGIHYLSEHLACSNFGGNCSKPIVDLIKMKHGDRRELGSTISKIVFLTKGKVIHLANHEKLIEANQMFFMPPGQKITIEAMEDSEMLICEIKDGVKLCDKYTPQNLAHDSLDSATKEDLCLPFNRQIQNYLNCFIPCLEDGLRCNLFVEGKIREMFFILRAYYTKEQLASFFKPLLSKDVEFTSFVWQNYRNANGVKSLADMANYSQSRFNEKFKQAFGVSALKWLNEQKARNIYYELKFSNKSFEEISDEFHFASASYLSTFCRQHFSKTPKEIRAIKSVE